MAIKFHEREQAVKETAQAERAELFRMLKETINKEVLEEFPLEFFALRGSGLECSICLAQLLGSKLARMLARLWEFMPMPP